jgi:hypothetical protein
MPGRSSWMPCAPQGVKGLDDDDDDDADEVNSMERVMENRMKYNTQRQDWERFERNGKIK